MSRHVMLIRHAEKPGRRGREGGLGADGEPSDAGLSVRGWQRAGALAALFSGRGCAARDPRLVVPTAVFAAADRPGSCRPSLTVAPLAAALGLPVRCDFQSDRDEARLAQAIADEAGPVLVSWRHTALPRLARLLARQAPRDTWPPAVYDEVWVCRDDAAGASTVTVVPQSLLDGDA